MSLNLRIRRCFPIIQKCLPLIDNTIVNNNTMIKYNPIGEGTFEGKRKCGPVSFILGLYLKHHGYPITFHYYQEGYPHEIKDHVYIRLDDLIIDPTWRQFFSTYSRTKNDYLNYIYNELRYCYIGTDEELENLYNILQEKHYKDFNHYLESDTLKFWKESWEIDYFRQNEKFVDQLLPIIKKLDKEVMGINIDGIFNYRIKDIVDREIDKYIEERIY